MIAKNPGLTGPNELHNDEFHSLASALAKVRSGAAKAIGVGPPKTMGGDSKLDVVSQLGSTMFNASIDRIQLFRVVPEAFLNPAGFF